MKYHRWEKVGDYYRCKKCGVSQIKKGHIISCPPTWFEKEMLHKIHYGNISSIDSWDELEFPLSAEALI